MNVAVLLGGISKEREISIKSGKAVAEALRANHTVTELDPKEPNFLAQLQGLKSDAAFIALHGRFGEDGKIQALLEWLQIPYTGPSVTASALCFDKILTKKILQASGVRTPRFEVCRRGGPLPARRQFGGWPPDRKGNPNFPVAVKPNREGSSFGIQKVDDPSQLDSAIQEVFRWDENVLVEEWISGRELTVGVLDGRALPIVEIRPKKGFYDFEAKYTKGMTDYFVPADLPKKIEKEVQEISLGIFHELKLSGAVRMDFILGAAPYFLEVNTIPGMTETSLLPKAAKASGMSFNQLCEEIICSAKLKG